MGKPLTWKLILCGGCRWREIVSSVRSYHENASLATHCPTNTHMGEKFKLFSLWRIDFLISPCVQENKSLALFLFKDGDQTQGVWINREIP